LKKLSFLKQISWLFSGQMASILLGILSVIIVSRALGPEGRGILSICLLLSTSLITFTEFGSGQAITRLTAAKKWKRADIYYSNFLVGIIRVILMLVIAAAILLFFKEFFFSGVPINLLILVLFDLIPVAALSYLLPYIFGLGRTAAYSIFLALTPCSIIILAVLYFIQYDITVKDILLLQIIWSFLIALVVLVYLKLKVKLGVKKFDIRYLKEAFIFGSGSFISNILIFTNSRLIFLVINTFLGLYAVGIYSLSFALAEKFYIISDAIGSALFVRASEKGLMKSELDFSAQVFRLNIILISILVLVFINIADYLIPFLLGKEFYDSIVLVKLLSFAFIFQCGWRVLWQILNGHGRSWVTARINVIITVSNIVLICILLPLWGLLGMAYAFVGASFLGMLLGANELKKLSQEKSFFSIILFSKEDFSLLFYAVNKIYRNLISS